jgi:hypothetical protein
LSTSLPERPKNPEISYPDGAVNVEQSEVVVPPDRVRPIFVVHLA